MKKSFILLFTVTLLTNTLSAQDCFQYKNGQSITSVTSSWVNTLPLDKKFVKGNDEKRSEMVTDYNQQVLDGKIKGFGGTPIKMSIETVDGLETISAINFVMGKYKFPVICINDTMMLYRNMGVQWQVADGDTIGASIQGASIIPNNLKVGDKLPYYEDYMTSISKKWNENVKRQVISGHKVVTTVERGFVSGFDNGVYKQGIGTKTSNSLVATYSTIEAEVEVTLESSIYIRHHAFATVTGSEEVTIGKNTYTAYIIESEKWVKGGGVTNWRSNNEELVSILEAEETRFQEIVNKKMIRKGLVNDQGYTVDYVTEWFVPGIGIVKMQSYDMHGVITARSAITSIN